MFLFTLHSYSLPIGGGGGRERENSKIICMFLTAMSNFDILDILLVHRMRILKLVREYSHKHPYEIRWRLDTDQILYQIYYGLCFKQNREQQQTKAGRSTKKTEVL